MLVSRSAFSQLSMGCWCSVTRVSIGLLIECWERCWTRVTCDTQPRMPLVLVIWIYHLMSSWIERFSLWEYFYLLNCLQNIQGFCFLNLLGADNGYFRISNAWCQCYRYRTYCNACSEWVMNNFSFFFANLVATMYSTRYMYYRVLEVLYKEQPKTIWTDTPVPVNTLLFCLNYLYNTIRIHRNHWWFDVFPNRQNVQMKASFHQQFTLS